jgi:hypothetical protein
VRLERILQLENLFAEREVFGEEARAVVLEAELVFASSRFCRRKRRLTASMVSTDGWGAIGGSFKRAIRAE